MPEEELHDHRYNFTSKLLAGRLQAQYYTVNTRESGFFLHSVSCDPKTPVVSGPVPCNIRALGQSWYMAGSEYQMFSHVFHRVKSQYAVTLIERGHTHKKFANVVRTTTDVGVCPFSKTVDDDELWHIVELMVPSCLEKFLV